MDSLTVVFDLDGTLIDTIGDLAAAVEYALGQKGYPGHCVDDYRKMVGHGIRNLVTRALPEGASKEVIDSASNKFQAGTEMLIGRFFPDIPFVRILGNAPGLPLKPDDAVVRLAMDAAETQRGVLVGDSATDIRTAHNAGIPAIAVSWGFRPKSDLAAAEAVADSVGELSNLIFEYLSGNSGFNSCGRQG